jgi:hypothetical protein
MPLYLVYCPDNTNVLDKRLEFRADHKELSIASRKPGQTGKSEGYARAETDGSQSSAAL